MIRILNDYGLFTCSFDEVASVMLITELACDIDGMFVEETDSWGLTLIACGSS